MFLTLKAISGSMNEVPLVSGMRQTLEVAGGNTARRAAQSRSWCCWFSVCSPGSASAHHVLRRRRGGGRHRRADPGPHGRLPVKLVGSSQQRPLRCPGPPGCCPAQVLQTCFLQTCQEPSARSAGWRVRPGDKFGRLSEDLWAFGRLVR